MPLPPLSKIKNSRFTNWFSYIFRVNTDKKTDKIDYLKLAYDDEPYVKILLYYCYSPQLKFYSLKPPRIAKKDWAYPDSRYKGKGVKTTYKRFIEIINLFIKGQLTKQEAQARLYTLYTTCNTYTKWVYNYILRRDLRLGSNYIRLKKYFPDLFTTSPITQKIIRVTRPIYHTPELVYIEIPKAAERTVIVSKDDYYFFMSINGIKKEINMNFKETLPFNIVLDGFFTYESIKELAFPNSLALTPIFTCIDYIPLSMFKDGYCDIPLQERLNILMSLKIWTYSLRLGVMIYNPKDIQTTNKVLIRDLTSHWGNAKWYSASPKDCRNI